MNLNPRRNGHSEAPEANIDVAQLREELLTDVPSIPPMEPAKRPNKGLVPYNPEQKRSFFAFRERAQQREIDQQKNTIQEKLDLLVKCVKAGQLSRRLILQSDGSVWCELHALVNSDGFLQSEHVATVTAF